MNNVNMDTKNIVHNVVIFNNIVAMNSDYRE